MEHDPLVAYFIIIDPRDSQAAFDLRQRDAAAGAEPGQWEAGRPVDRDR